MFVEIVEEEYPEVDDTAWWENWYETEYSWEQEK